MQIDPDQLDPNCKWPNCDQKRIGKMVKVPTSFGTNEIDMMYYSDDHCKKHKKFSKIISKKEKSVENDLDIRLCKKNNEGFKSYARFEKIEKIVLKDLWKVKEKLMQLDNISETHVIKAYDDYKSKQYKFIENSYWKEKVFKPKKYSKIIDCIYTDRGGEWILKYKPGKQFIHYNLGTTKRTSAVAYIKNAIEKLDENERKKREIEDKDWTDYIWIIIIAIIILVNIFGSGGGNYGGRWDGG